MRGFTDDAMTALQRYRWPGNVRELQNVIERAVLLGKESVVGVDALPSALTAAETVDVGSIAGRSLKTGPRIARAADHPRGAGNEPLEPQRHGRCLGHQPHHAL